MSKLSELEPAMYTRDGGVDFLVPSDGLHQTIAPVDFSTFQPVSINCSDIPRFEKSALHELEPTVSSTVDKVERLDAREGLEFKV